MKRRDFLKAAVAVPVAAALPGSGELTLARINAATTAATAFGRALLECDDVLGAYRFIVHPSVMFDIRSTLARDLWCSEYRKWRLIRRHGEHTESLEQLMVRVRSDLETPIPDWTMDKAERIALTYGICGYRFIEQARLP